MSQIIPNCYAGNVVYGKTIKEPIGLVEVKIGITQDDLMEDDKKTDIVQNKIKEALKNLMETAKNNGGNAVINVRITTGSHATLFNSYVFSKNYIIAYGDAVIVE